MKIRIRLGELKVQEGVFGSSAVRKGQKHDVIKWRFWIVSEYVFMVGRVMRSRDQQGKLAVVECIFGSSAKQKG